MSVKNNCQFTGFLAADPEIHYFQDGNMKVSGRLAVTTYQKKPEGEKQEHTEWVSFYLSGKPAEYLGNYAKKGMELSIQGEMRTRDWEQNGVKHYKTEIKVSDFNLHGYRQKNEQAQPQQGGYQQQAQPQQGGYQQQAPVGDMPF